MSGIQNYHHMTNRELAKLVDNNGVGAATPELLEHVALRFIEIFRNQQNSHGNQVTRVPLVVS
jgi:hypothetical protein